MTLYFKATKTYNHEVGLSCTFRQWRSESHCRFMHGYALSVKLEFSASKLDHRNFVIDFGSLKPIKSWLEETFDHKTLVALDDPNYQDFLDMNSRNMIQMVSVEATGCEKFAEMIFLHVQNWLVTTGQNPRVFLSSVEVREHGANSAICYN